MPQLSRRYHWPWICLTAGILLVVTSLIVTPDSSATDWEKFAGTGMLFLSFLLFAFGAAWILYIDLFADEPRRQRRPPPDPPHTERLS